MEEIPVGFPEGLVVGLRVGVLLGRFVGFTEKKICICECVQKYIQKIRKHVTTSNLERKKIILLCTILRLKNKQLKYLQRIFI